jgi:hypothetical protein
MTEDLMSPDAPAREHLQRCWMIASVDRPPEYSLAEWTGELLQESFDSIAALYASIDRATLPPPRENPPPEVAALARRYILDFAHNWLQAELDRYCAGTCKPFAEIDQWFETQMDLFGYRPHLRWAYDKRVKGTLQPVIQKI